MPRLHIGTSGFASPALRSNLSAPTGAAPDLLAAYASRFDCVEMDSTFQRPPTPETVRTWDEATPDHFGFSVRVPKPLTHGDELSDPSRVSELVGVLRELGDGVRCLLFTLPPTLDCDPERVSGVLDAVPDGLPTAWEFRNPAGPCPEVCELIASRGGTAVVVDNLDGTSGTEYLTGSKWEFPCCYVRFRRESYSIADLMHWGGVLGAAAAEGRDVFAFFRQSLEAPSYVLALSELLQESAP